MENLKNNKPFLIAIIVGSVLLISTVFYFISSEGKDKKEKPATTIHINTLEEKKKSKEELGEEYYEEEYYVSTLVVIANTASIRSAPNNKKENVVSDLKFGTKVYSNDHEGGEFKKVFLVKPKNDKNPTETVYYIRANSIVDEYQFDEYKSSFSMAPFKDLHSDIKHLILENDRSGNRSYVISQNENRIKKAVCYGDFDKDGLRDLAVLMDEHEDQYTRILVICHNKATQKPYVAFAQNFSEIMRVNSFNAGAKIINRSGDLQSTAVDGIIIQGSYEKYAIVYDLTNFNFNLIDQNANYATEEEAEY